MPERHASSAAAVSTCRAGAPIARADPEAAARRVRVLLPLPLPEALDYRIGDAAAMPEPGSFVRVPLGGRSRIGVVWDGEGSNLAPDRL
ncbi:MAG: primosomal protein N', partial [Stellaceae bacterium]